MDRASEGAARIREILAGETRMKNHAAIARRIRGPSSYADPRLLACGLGLELVELSEASPVPVMADRRRVLYQPHADPRQEGWRILQGVVEAELCRRGRHTAADLWLVMAALAVPEQERRLDVGQLLDRQRWVPGWFLRLACSPSVAA